MCVCGRVLTATPRKTNCDKYSKPQVPNKTKKNSQQSPLPVYKISLKRAITIEKCASTIKASIIIAQTVTVALPALAFLLATENCFLQSWQSVMSLSSIQTESRDIPVTSFMSDTFCWDLCEGGVGVYVESKCVWACVCVCVCVVTHRLSCRPISTMAISWSLTVSCRAAKRSCISECSYITTQSCDSHVINHVTITFCSDLNCFVSLVSSTTLFFSRCNSIYKAITLIIIFIIVILNCVSNL